CCSCRQWSWVDARTSALISTARCLITWASAPLPKQSAGANQSSQNGHLLYCRQLAISCPSQVPVSLQLSRSTTPTNSRLPKPKSASVSTKLIAGEICNGRSGRLPEAATGRREQT